MASGTFKKAGTSTTSPIDNKTRKIVKAKNGPVCWVADYEMEIRADAPSKYYSRTLLNGSVDPVENNARYRMILPCKSASAPVVLEVRLFPKPVVNAENDRIHLSDLTNPRVIERLNARKAAIEKIKRDCENGVDKHLNSKLRLQVRDPICGDRIFPIRVSIVWVDDEQDCHFTYLIHGQQIRAMVADTVVHIWIGDDEHTHAHEIAHCLGLPDEYSYGEFVTNVQYFNPAGQLGEPIVAMPENDASLHEFLSIMNEGEAVKAFHGWPFAIEAQEILRRKIGGRITCDTLLA